MIFDVPRITSTTISTINPVTSSVVFDTEQNVFKYWDGFAWRSFGDDVTEYTGEPTGFPVGADGEIDRTSSSISFDPVTRNFTIAPTTSSFQILIKGKIFQKTTPQVVQIGTSEGVHHVYFNESGVLTSSTTFGLEIIYKYVYVASVYWDAQNSVAVHVGDERHGCTMDGHTHARIHQRDGAVFLSGMALSNFVADGNGSSDTHTQFAIASGAIRDEDILHTRSAVGSTSSIPVLYRVGTAWRKTTVTAQKAYSAPSGRLYWNNPNTGSYSLAQAANNRYVLYHIVATNDKDFPFFSIMGTGEYQTKPEAQTAAIEEIKTFSGLPFVEFVIVGTVIFQTSDSFTNSLKAAVVSTAVGATYVDWRFSGPGLNPTTANATTHNNLGGLQGGGNGDYYHSNQAVNTDSSPTFVNISATGNVSISGNLVVTGTTSTLNTVDLAISDKNIEIGKVATPTDVTADGGGITLKGTTDKTIIWSANNWTFSENVNLVSGKSFRIDGVSVLSATSVLGKNMPTGDVVGTSDTQVLSGKTISGASNTLSNIANSSLQNSSITINGTVVSLGGSVTTSGFTSADIVANGSIGSWSQNFVFTNNGAISLTLPSSPSNGDKIIIIDSDYKSGINPITVLRNGRKINNVTDDLLIDINGACVELVYNTTKQNWQIVNDPV